MKNQYKISFIAMLFVGIVIGIVGTSVISQTASEQTSNGDFINELEYPINEDIINVLSSQTISDVDTLTLEFIPVEKADELTPKAEALKS